MDSGSEQRSNGKAEKRRSVTGGGWPAGLLRGIFYAEPDRSGQSKIPDGPSKLLARLETGVHAVELQNGTKSFPQSRGGPRRSHRPRKNPSAVTDSRYKFQSRLELELDKTDQVHRSVILFVIGSEKFPSSASRFWRAFIPDFF